MHQLIHSVKVHTPSPDRRRRLRPGSWADSVGWTDPAREKGERRKAVSEGGQPTRGRLTIIICKILYKVIKRFSTPPVL